jgi:hypothetical protein
VTEAIGPERQSETTKLPVACALTERELAERRAGLFAELRPFRQEARWLADGVALDYAAEPGVIAALGRVIELEHQCCPFLRFRLSVDAGGGRVSLELTGPDGTREFLVRALHLTGEPGAGSPNALEISDKGDVA